MGLIYAITAALCAWIVMWALDVSAFDAGLLALVVMVVAVGVKMLAPTPTHHD